MKYPTAALALGFGLGGVFAQDESIANAETPLDRFREDRLLQDETAATPTIECYVQTDSLGERLPDNGERAVYSDAPQADLHLCDCLLMRNDAWKNSEIDCDFCGSVDGYDLCINDSAHAKQKENLEVAKEMCDLAAESTGLNCDVLDETGVEGAATVCESADKLLELGDSDSSVLREFLQCIFAHTGDEPSSNPPEGCEELSAGVILDYAWQLLQAQWMWLLPLALLIFFLICLLIIVPLSCCCFKSCCYRFRCRNICCCDMCYTDDDPNKAPRWSFILKIVMVFSMFLFTVVGIAIVLWANITFLPKMTGGIEDTMCDAANMINIVNYGDQNALLPKADQKFIGFSPASDVFDELKLQLLDCTVDDCSGLEDGTNLRDDVNAIVGEYDADCATTSTPLCDLTTASAAVSDQIDILSAYADENAAVTGKLTSDFITNFPTDELQDVNTALSEGTATTVESVHDELNNFWNSDQVADLNRELVDAEEPMNDMQNQLDEIGELFVGDGKDVFDNFRDYAGTGLMAVGGVFGVFTFIAFLLAFFKVFVFEFDQGSYHANDPSNAGGCCGPKGKRHPFFGTICALTCFFALMGLLVGGIILLLTVPVSESCSLMNDMLYSANPTDADTARRDPHDVMTEELPLLIPNTDPNNLDDGLEKVIDLAAICIAEPPEYTKEVTFDQFLQFTSVDVATEYLRVGTSGKLQVASGLQLTSVDDEGNPEIAYLGAYVFKKDGTTQLETVDEFVTEYTGETGFQIKEDPSLLNALGINFDINGQMSAVTDQINGFGGEDAAPNIMDDPAVSGDADNEGLFPSIDNYGYIWRFSDDTLELAAQQGNLGGILATDPDNIWFSALSAQSGDLYSDDDTITVTRTTNGVTTETTLNHLKSLMNKLSTSGSLDLEVGDVCVGIVGLDEPIGCGTSRTALKEITINTATTDAQTIAQYFGSELYDGLTDTSYTCDFSYDSTTDAAVQTGSSICSAVDLQAELQTIRNDLATKMTTLDNTAGPMANTLITGILDSLDARVVAPTQRVLDMMNCQAFGKQVRSTLDNLCGEIYPGLRGLATAWAFLGFMGVICSILMYFIWHHLKVKYIWENGHSHSDHYDDEKPEA